MDVKITGGCLCGAIRYEATQAPVWSHNCHCSRCRMAGGAAFASNLFIPADAFAFTRGEALLSRFEIPEAESFTHVFCSRCGSTLPFPSKAPGLVGLPMGTLDGDPAFSPRAHIFVDSKAPWFSITDSLPQNAEGLGTSKA